MSKLSLWQNRGLTLDQQKKCAGLWEKRTEAWPKTARQRYNEVVQFAEVDTISAQIGVILWQVTGTIPDWLKRAMASKTGVSAS